MVHVLKLPGVFGNQGIKSLLEQPLFADGFESGDLTAWDSSATDSGDLSAETAAAAVGTYGLQAVIDDNNAI